MRLIWDGETRQIGSVTVRYTCQPDVAYIRSCWDAHRWYALTWDPGYDDGDGWVGGSMERDAIR